MKNSILNSKKHSRPNLVFMIAIKDFQLQANFAHKIFFSDILNSLWFSLYQIVIVYVNLVLKHFGMDSKKVMSDQGIKVAACNVYET